MVLLSISVRFHCESEWCASFLCLPIRVETSSDSGTERDQRKSSEATVGNGGSNRLVHFLLALMRVKLLCHQRVVRH
jgi:hypothetical protein